MLPVVQDVADVIAGFVTVRYVYRETRHFISRRQKPSMAASDALANAVIARGKGDLEGYVTNIEFFRWGRLPSRSDQLLADAKYTVNAGIQLILSQSSADDVSIWKAIFDPQDKTRDTKMAGKLWSAMPSVEEIIHAYHELLPETLADIDANIHAPITKKLSGMPIYAQQWMRDRFVNEAHRNRMREAFERSLKDGNANGWLLQESTPSIFS